MSKKDLYIDISSDKNDLFAGGEVAYSLDVGTVPLEEELLNVYILYRKDQLMTSSFFTSLLRRLVIETKAPHQWIINSKVKLVCVDDKNRSEFERALNRF